MAGLLMLLDLDTSYPLLLILTSGALLLPLLHTAGPVPAAALSKGPLPSAAAAPAAAGYLRFGNFPSLVASIPGVAVMASVLLHTLMQSAYFLGLLALDLFLAACLQMQLGATLWSPAKQQQLKAGDSSSCSRHQRNPSGGGSSGHALPQMLNMCMRLLPKAITASLPLLAGVTQVVAASDTLVTPVSSTSDALLIMLAMAWSSSLYQVPLAVQLPLSLVEWLLLFYAHGAPFTSGAARLASTTGANTSILQHIWYSVLAVLISTAASKSALVNSLRTSVMSGMTQLLAGAGMLCSPHPSSSSPAATGDGGRPRQQMHRLSHSSNSSLGTSSYRDSSEEPRGSVELEKYKSCSTAQFDEDVADSWRCGAGRCGSQSSRTTADTGGSAHPLQTPAISSSRSLSSKLSLGQASSGAAEVPLSAARGEGPAAAATAAQLAPAGSDVHLHGVTGSVTSGTRVTTPLPVDVDVTAMKQEVHEMLDQDVRDVSSGLAMQRSSSASSILSFDASALAAMAAGQHGGTPGATSAAGGRSASSHATGPGSYEAHAPTAAAGPSKATAAERFLQSLVNTCGPTGGTTTTNPAAAAPPAPPAAAVGAHRSRYMSQHPAAAPAVPASPYWGLAASNGAVTDDSAYAPPMGNLSPPGAAATNSNSSSVPGMATVAAADLLAAAAGHVSATGHPAAAAAGVHEVTNISPQQVVADLSSTFHPSPAPQAVPWSTLARHQVTPTPGYTGYSVTGSGMRATCAASSRGTSSSSSSHMGAHNAAGATAAAAAQRQAAGRSAALRAVAATMGEEFASSLEGVSDAALAQLTSGGTVKERLLMPYTSVTQMQPVGCKVYSPGSYGFDTISHLLTTSLHHSAAAATGGSAYITSTCVNGCVQLLGAVLSPVPNAGVAGSNMQLAAAAGGGGLAGSKDAPWLAAFGNAVTAGVGNWAHLDQLPPPEVVLQPVQAPASHQQQQQRMTQHLVAPKAGDAARTGAVAQLHGSFPCCLAAGQDQLVTLVISIDPQRLALLQQQQAASHARLQAVAAARVAAVANQGSVPSAAAEAAAKAAAPLLANEALATANSSSSSSSSSSGVVGKAGNASGSPSGVEWRMVVHQAGAAVLDVEVKLEEGGAGLQAIRLPLPALSHGAATISLLAGQSHVAVTSILPVLPAPAAEEVNATWQQLSRFDSALYPASGVASSQLSSKATQSPVAVWGEVMAPFMQDVAYTAGQLSSGNTAAAAAVLQAVLQGAASLGCWQLVEYLVNQHQRYKAAAEDTVDRTISSEQDSSGAAGLQPNQFAAERSASSFTSTTSSKGRSAVSNVTLPTIAASSSGGSSSGSCCTSPFAAYAHQGGCFGALGEACSGAMPSSTTLVGLQHGNTAAAAASVDHSFTALLSDPSSSMGQRQRSQLSNSSSLGQADMESRRRSSSAMDIGTPDMLLSPGGSRDLLSSSMRLNSSSSSAASSSKGDQLWRIPVKGLPGLQLQRSTSVDSGLSVHFSKPAKRAAVTAAAAAGFPCPGGLLKGASGRALVSDVPVKAASCASPQQRLLMEAFLMLQFASTTVMCFQQQLTTASPGDATHTSSSDATGPLVKTMASLLLLSPPAVLLGGRSWLPPALQQVVTAACVAAGPLVVLVQPFGGVLQTAVAVVQYGAAAPLILQGPMRLAAALLVVELVALCIGTWCLGQHLAAFEAAVAGAAATAATALLFTLHAHRAAPGPAAALWGGAVRAGV